jgi:hypothetical protein
MNSGMHDAQCVVEKRAEIWQELQVIVKDRDKTGNSCWNLL